MANTENNFKVRLIPISALIGGDSPDIIRASQVAFDVTPTFSESGSVEYTPVSPIHMPGAIQMYKSTSSRTFEIGAVLVSRNVEDAIKNMKKLQLLRGWRMPYFGTGSSTLTEENQKARNLQASLSQNEQLVSAEDQNQMNLNRIKAEGVELLGAPPDVLYLYAYSTSANDGRPSQALGVNINRVPVVMTNLSITYPDDVDYIPVYDSSKGGPTVNTEPFPRKLQVNVSLVETHSPREFEHFSLSKFKDGKLVNF